ncbi:carbohydrate ABC transporter permease [Bianquea renquensis]|jgi:ABC transporter, permease protein|uniref:Carbohydrate ABC transporter permease n=1 Tax=Bianquea renquensis TaxID=2763661 RepID=A0A926DR64_9FIRM|nr:carbohydrate ABC transporter permease [Bianquea renquensis]MBC8542548.1 carbohydrate ABC transporter permease [Bianquea renquensis]
MAKTKSKIKDGSRIFDAFCIFFCALICLVTLYPMYYVLIMSLSEPAAVNSMSVFLYPKGFQLKSYTLLFKDSSMWRAYGNTIIYAASSTLLTLITSVLAAYPLTVHGLHARRFFVTYLLIPMYFSGGLIPSFLLINNLGLYGTRWAIILPASYSIWNIMLVRTFFSNLPEDLRESAKMDGAAHIRILFQIYLPLAKSILAVVAIYSIVGMWNSWFNAQVYLPTTELQPLQMYLKRVLVQMSVDLTKLNSTEIEDAMEQMFSATQLKYSMIIFTTLPIIFTYPFFQKYFIKGVMVGSLKG